MSFTAPLFLTFALFASVPLVLHLYHRRKRLVVDFSTNRFFTATIIQSQRRMRLQRLLLMLLRILACILLAMAVARPVLEFAGLGSAAGKRDLVILLDDSLSMRANIAVGAGRATRFEQAKKVVGGAIEELQRGDRAAVITYSGKVLGSRLGGELTRRPASLLPELEQLEATASAGDPFWALEQAARVLDTPEQRGRLVLIVSDMQASQWPRSAWPQPREKIRTVLVRVGPPPHDNLVADSMKLSQAVAVVGQPNTLELRLKNHRLTSVAAELAVDVDGEAQTRRPVRVPGQSVHVELVPLRFDASDDSEAAAAAGRTHRVKVHLELADALAADNTLYATIHARRTLPVLLIDGQSGAPPRSTAAFYLRTALRAATAERDSIPVETVSVADLEGVRWGDYRVVVLAGVRRLAAPEAERLARFVGAGGGLLAFLAEAPDRKFYDMTPPGSLGRLFPGKIGELQTLRQVEEPLQVVEAQWDHAVLERFVGTLRGALAGINVRQVFRLEPGDAAVVARLENGLPLLLEKTYGQGRVMLATTSPQPAWTNLPLRRNFISLMNRLVSYLAAGGKTSAGHEVGADLPLPASATELESTLDVITPNGKAAKAQKRAVGARAVAYLGRDKVTVPGFYRSGAADSESSAVLAVNCPRSESTLAELELDEAKRFSGNWELSRADLGDAKEGQGLDSKAAVDQVFEAGDLSGGVWDQLLWIVLLLLLIEPMIAHGLRRASKARAPTQPASAQP